MATRKGKDANITGRGAQKESLDELLQQAQVQTKDIEAKGGSWRRPIVASFITRSLIVLFLFQAVLLTVAYLTFVWRYGSDAALLKQTTESVLEGIKSILPATTTLLGVAIGYYFREEMANSRDEDQR
jgi:hypothetical protein